MTRTLLAASAAIAMSLAVSLPASAASPEDRAREAADESPQALRTFVQRTRMIYALNIQDFATARDEATEPTEAALSGADEADRAQRESEELREQIYRDMLHE